MYTRIFWALLLVDAGTLGVLAWLASKGPSSPEGPVGGWLVFIPPVALVLIATVVLIARSDAAKMAGIALLGGPWVFVVIGPAYDALQSYLSDRRLAGDADFHGPSRKLAHAIQARDLALVQQLIPLAGDLNRQHGKETLLDFAVSNAPDPTKGDRPVPAASLEIVGALLAAGANADLPTAGVRCWPLTSAIFAGPELTEMLLKAGANPNHLDDAGRPLWWQVLSDDTDRGFQTLQVLLDRGADITIRDSEGGPAARAAYFARAAYNSNWRLVYLLVQRGAAWKGERSGQPVAEMLQRDCEERERQGKPLSEEMRKLRELR